MQFSDTFNSSPKFTGQVPLFPLPNVALFPNVMLPLHVFEPRYRQMVETVLNTDRIIALAALKDDWQLSYETKDCPIHETVCLGQIVAEERLSDGRYCLLIQGICRAQLLSEVETSLPYRVGQVSLVKDLYPTIPVIDRNRRQQELVHYFQQIVADIDLDSSLIQALESGVPLGELCDVIAHAMRLDAQKAQRLLEQVDVDQRSDLVLELLKHQCRRPKFDAKRTFPPKFSLN